VLCGKGATKGERRMARGKNGQTRCGRGPDDGDVRRKKQRRRRLLQGWDGPERKNPSKKKKGKIPMVGGRQKREGRAKKEANDAMRDSSYHQMKKCSTKQGSSRRRAGDHRVAVTRRGGQGVKKKAEGSSGLLVTGGNQAEKNGYWATESGLLRTGPDTGLKRGKQEDRDENQIKKCAKECGKTHVTQDSGGPGPVSKTVALGRVGRLKPEKRKERKRGWSRESASHSGA